MGALLPLLVGSIIFFYWFYERNWFAEDFNIYIYAMFTIAGFIVCAIITLILCAVFVLKNRTEWKKIIVPILIIGFTLPVIHLYETTVKTFSQKAFVRIINDTDKEVGRFWSDDFQMWGDTKRSDDYVISFYPVYKYDWHKTRGNSYNIPHTTNEVFVDLITDRDSMVTYTLPKIEKGECKTIRLSELTKARKVNTNLTTYGREILLQTK